MPESKFQGSRVFYKKIETRIENSWFGGLSEYYT